MDSQLSGLGIRSTLAYTLLRLGVMKPFTCTGANNLMMEIPSVYINQVTLLLFYMSS